jgi:predicted Rossmann fold nucleotide-binding protein DprA/Smf involved in DNA uptake
LEKRETLLGFAETDFLSVPRISQLKNHFGSLESAWNYTDQKEFIAAGVSQRSVASFWKNAKKQTQKKWTKKSNP